MLECCAEKKVLAYGNDKWERYHKEGHISDPQPRRPKNPTSTSVEKYFSSFWCFFRISFNCSKYFELNTDSEALYRTCFGHLISWVWIVEHRRTRSSRLPLPNQSWYFKITHSFLLNILKVSRYNCLWIFYHQHFVILFTKKWHLRNHNERRMKMIARVSFYPLINFCWKVDPALYSFDQMVAAL